MATIKEIAKEANVSPSTVSRVLSGSKKISPETTKRVLEAIKKLGYVPNANAKGLVKKKSFTVGIFVPREPEHPFLNFFFDQILTSICAVINKFGYDILFAYTQEDKEEDLLKRLAESKKVDGFILLSSREDDFAIEYLKKIEFPFVVVGRPQKYENSVNWVDNDNVQAGFDAAEYLIKLGHKNIAFIGGPSNLIVTQDRLEGYKKALERYSIQLKNSYIRFTNYFKKSLYEIAKELLTSEDRPTAIVCMDDLIAIEVVKATRELGVEIGKEVSVISFNNSIVTEVLTPPLTTIDINISNIGHSAAELLMMDLTEPRKTYKRLIVPHKIVERKSCTNI
ncbi:LacI family DNA-binding transcriptional regulator [Caldicellulosiruptor naganoensis]|uniref:LacI family transcriptional regulator n=1 Tax=Caldicellulosiruptor naganoensis TaxID=29324 RepID=A0ABY7BHN1_9FIRM|nr:LacI family DNA-binding transcriptional regulator [Caldicellulosiruptor naganoensis]WAM31852.1 LacI family transcriptional regulator [Caldicellulosiruptor naganoensis]